MEKIRRLEIKRYLSQMKEFHASRRDEMKREMAILNREILKRKKSGV
jgi:hypothetical protein